MKIKGEREAKFQIDTGATCNVIKACEITGAKYANKVTQTTQMLKMLNSTTLRPIGKCKIQVCNPKSNQKHKVTFMVVLENAKSKFATPKVTKSTKSPSWSYQMKPVLTSSGAKPHSRWDFLIFTSNNYITV